MSGERSMRRTVLALAAAIALAGCSAKGGKGGADAAKDKVTLRYANDPDGGAQATLVQNAIDSRVDAIAVTLAKPEALSPVLRKAQAAGIPVVVINTGIEQWKDAGAVSYFGSDDGVAGEGAGKRAAEDGAKHVLCVSHEQGQVGQEARCDGLRRGFAPGRFVKLYVIGTDMPSVRSTMAAKLRQDPSIDLVVTLGAPFAITAIEAVKEAGSRAKIATFDSNPQVPAAIRSGALQWAVDQQPYLQGYLAVDALWLQKTNGHVIGGGGPVLTGPYFIDRTNVDRIEKFAAAGTR